MASTDPMLRRRFYGYLGFMAVVLAALLFDVRQNLRVETDLLALLPAEQHDPGVDQALKEVSGALGGRVIFLIGAHEFAQAHAAAQRFAATLAQSPAFSHVLFKLADSGLMSHEVYDPYLPALAAGAQLQQLRAGEIEKLKRDALHALYAPLPAPQALPVAQDPLGLANAFLLQRLPPAGNALPRDGVLTVSGDGFQYVLVAAELTGAAFAADNQDRVLAVVAQAEAGAQQGLPAGALRVVRAGLVFHAAAGTRESKREIELISSVSLIAVAVLVLLIFGSLRPLLLTATSLTAGTLCGLVACHYIFGSVHLLTLVFGSTLIGVAVDYSNYFLHDAFDDFEGWTPARALDRTSSGILLGLTTAALGYMALLLAPFPGLRQMALFSAIGLIGAGGCVLCLYPVLARAPRNPRPLLLRGVIVLHEHLNLPRPALVFAALAGAALLAGLARLHAQDDIRLLQASPPAIVADEIALRALVGNAPDSRFFLVRGPDAEGVLQREEALRMKLDAAVASGALSSYTAISRALPSQRTQLEIRELLARHVYGEQGALAALMRELGFDAATIGQRQQAFNNLPKEGLAVGPWLASPAAMPYRALWLPRVGEGSATLVMLSNVRDVVALRAIASDGALLVDKVAEISDVLGRYRVVAARLLVLSYLAAALLLALRYGARRGLLLLAGNVAAALLTLGLFGWLGIAVNLFNMLALLLVLGIGIDYAIFMQEGHGQRAGATLAVVLSAATTLLSFGLLAFSSTPFIRSLGLTLASGIGFAFIFALLRARPPPAAA